MRSRSRSGAGTPRVAHLVQPLEQRNRRRQQRTDGGQSAQVVVPQLPDAAFRIDDGRDAAQRVGAVDGRIAQRIGHAGQPAAFIVGEQRRLAGAVRVFDQLRAQVPAHVLVARGASSNIQCSCPKLSIIFSANKTCHIPDNN